MLHELSTLFFLAVAGLAFLLPMGTLRIYGNQRKDLHLWDSENANEMVRPKEWDTLFNAWSGLVSALVSLCGIQVQLVGVNPPKIQRAAIAVTTALLTLSAVASFSLVHHMEHASYGNDFSSDIDVKSDAGPGTWLLFGVSFATLITGVIAALPSRKRALE